MCGLIIFHMGLCWSRALLVRNMFLYTIITYINSLTNVTLALKIFNVFDGLSSRQNKKEINSEVLDYVVFYKIINIFGQISFSLCLTKLQVGVLLSYISIKLRWAVCLTSPWDVRSGSTCLITEFINTSHQYLNFKFCTWYIRLAHETGPVRVTSYGSVYFSASVNNSTKYWNFKQITSSKVVELYSLWASGIIRTGLRAQTGACVYPSPTYQHHRRSRGEHVYVRLFV